MKTFVLTINLFACLFFLSLFSQAQFIPNGDFETWSSNTGNFLPVGWKSQSIQSDPNSIKATAPGYNSAQALNIKVTSIGGGYTHADLYRNINLFERPTSLTGAVWGNALSGDSLYICARLYKDGQFVGEAKYVNTTYIASFTPFEALFSYANSMIPDSLIVIIKNRINSGMSSTFHMVDGLNLTGVTSIDELTFFDNFQLYPNPTSGEFSVELNSDISEIAQLFVFDSKGRKVAVRKTFIEIGENKIQFDLGSLPAGLYFYQIESNRINQSGKINLIK